MGINTAQFPPAVAKASALPCTVVTAATGRLLLGEAAGQQSRTKGGASDTDKRLIAPLPVCYQLWKTGSTFLMTIYCFWYQGSNVDPCACSRRQNH